MKEKIGFVGLGIMGRHMSAHLLEAGYEVAVFDIVKPAVDEIAAQGGKACSSYREVAQVSDVVISMVPDSPDVEKVALGEGGIIESAREGLIYIDMSSIAPKTAIKVAEELGKKGVLCLDAPVSGGEIGAQNGTLTIMVGGSATALETVHPVLNAIGKLITHVGDSGAGQIAKVANQIMVGAQMVAMAELLILAKKTGTDPEKVVEAIRAGAAQCWALDHKPQRLFNGERKPGFKAAMQYKDMNIVMDTAREYGIPLPLTAITTQLYAAMCAMGMEALDNSAVIGVIEKLAGSDLLS